jgi:hypothetical protein
MPQKTEVIFATSNNHTLLYEGKAKIIGYRVGFDSGQQKVRYTGSGCICPGIVAFHYGSDKEDIFMFEDGYLAYMMVNIKSEDESYLTDIYSRAVREKWNEQELIDATTEAYTFKKMGF